MKAYVITLLRRGKPVGQPEVHLDPEAALESYEMHLELGGQRSDDPTIPATGSSREAPMGSDGVLRMDTVQAIGDYAIPRGIVNELITRGNAPDAPSTTALAREDGIGQTTVSAILRGARRATPI